MLKNKTPNGKILKLSTVNDPSKLKSKVCKNDKILLALLPVQNIFPQILLPNFHFMFVIGNWVHYKTWFLKDTVALAFIYTGCDMILVFYEALSICGLDNSASSLLWNVYYNNNKKANLCLMKVLSICCSCSPYSALNFCDVVYILGILLEL